MTPIRSGVRAAAAVVLLVTAAVAARADAPPAQPEPSLESRAKMAVLYEQMAACLRAGTALAGCREAMVKSCQSQLGTECFRLLSLAGRGAAAPHRMRPMNDTSPAAPR